MHVAKQRDTVAVRERQIQQDDVGPVLLQEIERAVRARALAYDIEAIGRQDEPQTLTDQVMVLDERDADRSAGRSW
jgi:hypothetical protein